MANISLSLCLAVLLGFSTALAHDYDPYPDEECSQEVCVWHDDKLIGKIEICKPCDDNINGEQIWNLLRYNTWVCEKDCSDGSTSNCRWENSFTGQHKWFDEEAQEERKHTRHLIAIFQIDNLKPNQWYEVSFECEDDLGNTGGTSEPISFRLEVCDGCYIDEICCWDEYGDTVPCFDGDTACFQEPIQ